MKREITFGDHTAIIDMGEGRAMLTVLESSLPVQLADALDAAGDMDATEVSLIPGGACIRIAHDLPAAELLSVVCETISDVYDTDTTISYARAEDSI